MTSRRCAPCGLRVRGVGQLVSDRSVAGGWVLTRLAAGSLGLAPSQPLRDVLEDLGASENGNCA